MDVITSNRPDREPNMYIGKGKRRRPIYISFIGVDKNDGCKEYLNPLEDINDPIKSLERLDKFAKGFGFSRREITTQ